MSRLKQPAPIVSKADVERIVRRDDSRDNFHKVISMLNEYGAEDRQREPDRVRLAVLKLANGNIEELKRFLGWAKCDYRDVLSPAEYPMASEIWFRMEKMIKEDIETIFQQDWEQYEYWLEKGLA